jgi:hypothetical protein
MRWHDFVFSAGMFGLALSLPAGVIWGWVWWGKNGRDLKGWRWGLSKAGVIYSTLILGSIIGFVVLGPKNSHTAAEFPYTYRWGPKIFWFSSIGIINAVFGRGRIRIANVVCALAGCTWAVLFFALL